jgi:hypothetical protein
MFSGGLLTASFTEGWSVVQLRVIWLGSGEPGCQPLMINYRASRVRV